MQQVSWGKAILPCHLCWTKQTILLKRFTWRCEVIWRIRKYVLIDFYFLNYKSRGFLLECESLEKCALEFSILNRLLRWYFTEEDNQSLSFFMFMIVEIIYVKYVNEATCINHEVLCAERIVCLHCSWCLYIHFSLMFRLVLDQIWYISRQSELLRNIWFLNGILINNLSWSSKLLYIAFDEKKIKLKIGLF